MTVHPPALAEKILRALLAPQDQEIVASDLLEEYRDKVEARGPQEARSWYVRQVFGFLISAPWFACCVRTAGGWLGAFLAAAMVSVNLPIYTPVPAVAVLLLAIPVISFYVANRSGNFLVGMAAVLLSCSAMLGVAVLFLPLLELRHPPLAGLFFPLTGGILFAVPCAFAGKASREGIQAVHLLR